MNASLQARNLYRSRVVVGSNAAAAAASRCGHAWRRAITSKSSKAVFSTSKSSPNLLLCTFIGFCLGGALTTTLDLPINRQIPAKLIFGSHSPKYATQHEVQKAIEELKCVFPEKNQVLTSADVLESYGNSPNFYLHGAPHSVVVKTFTTDDVVKVVMVAKKWRMPVTAWSGGTSLEGHFSGTTIDGAPGGICIDLSRMNNVIEINEGDSDMVVQSGIKWEEVNRVLAERKIPLFFPLDPGPGATIGGMIATGCSGTNAVKYGTAKGEWFLNITVVLPSGEVIKTRRRARKSAAGFDLTKLFIGAEGTLGIVTEATLRLAPKIPTSVAVAQFPDVQNAVSAVTEVLRSPLGSNIQCVELLDNNMMDAINHAGLSRPFPVKDSLFFKFQGSPSSIAETSRLVREIVGSHGAELFQSARSTEEADELWNHRKVGFWSTFEWVDDPNTKIWTTDVCVPPSKLPQLVKETKEDMQKHGILSTILGHVGDGNFHALMVFRNDRELEVVRGAVHRLVHRALALEGTCTGEHGVGLGKKDYLYEELGEGTVDLMHQIKNTIDPMNLFNPGKLYPDPKRKKR